MWPRIRDSEDELQAAIRQLTIALQNAENGGGAAGDNVTINQTVNEENDGRGIFSTGPDPLLVEDSSEFTEIEFGFVAKVVSIRTTGDIVVAFSQRAATNGGHLKIRQNQDVEESPFSIGGEAGIDVSKIWIKKAETAETTPAIQLLAYK